MFPNPFLMARIGQSFNDIMNDDLIRKLEGELFDWEQYAQGLEQRLKRLTERYKDLTVNAGRVIEYAKSIEKERDRLREENNRLRRIIRD